MKARNGRGVLAMFCMFLLCWAFLICALQVSGRWGVWRTGWQDVRMPRMRRGVSGRFGLRIEGEGPRGTKVYTEWGPLVRKPHGAPVEVCGLWNRLRGGLESWSFGNVLLVFTLLEVFDLQCSGGVERRGSSP